MNGVVTMTGRNVPASIQLVGHPLGLLAIGVDEAVLMPRTQGLIAPDSPAGKGALSLSNEGDDFCVFRQCHDPILLRFSRGMQ